MTKTKILLVEDDKSLREIYGVRLYEEGYDIVSAGDGEEALAMAIKDRPNLIISDVMMPKISGFDMLDILRSTTETKNIKVIIMTALSSEEQRQRGVSLGADRYLVKSQVGIEDVVRTVHEILQDAPIAGQPVMVSRPSAPANRSAARSSAPIMPGLGARPAASVTMPPRTSAPEDESIQPQQTAQPTPVQSAPIPAPAPIPVAPVEQPQPQAQPQPQSAPVPQAPVQQSVLPEPIAPFSTPRINGAGTLADRVIQPIEQPKQDTPDMAQLMNQALAGEAQPAPVQSAPIPAPAPIPVAPVEQPQPQAQPQPQPAPVPQAPVQPNPSMVAPSPSPLSSQAVSFEETPRATSSPAGGSTTPPGAA